MKVNDPSFFIGPLPVYGELALAPMDGFSDQPFRSICRELGSALSYTEFTNAIDVEQGWAGLLAAQPQSTAGPLRAGLERRLAFLPFESPVIFQVFDDDPQRLLRAALRLQELGPDAIDINMGCSVRCVSGRGAGAGLLRTPLKVAHIFHTLSAALHVPLTGKIRLGWDEGSRNHTLVARIIEENGGALVAVHGRTRAQGYGGQADWDAIAEVKQAVKIPVLGNGDVRTPADIRRMQAHTGCDGVLIGRSAIGNPWIFARLERVQVPPEEVRRMMLLHLERMLEFYGPAHGLVLFRKHASRYISPYPLDNEARQRLLTADKPAEFLAVLEGLLVQTATHPS